MWVCANRASVFWAAECVGMMFYETYAHGFNDLMLFCVSKALHSLQRCVCGIGFEHCADFSCLAWRDNTVMGWSFGPSKSSQLMWARPPASSTQRSQPSFVFYPSLPFLKLNFPLVNCLRYVPRGYFAEFCLRAGSTAAFSQVRGGPFGPLHRNISKVSPFFSDTVCPLKVTCDSCCITAHLVTLLPESSLDPVSLDTTHGKMLAKSFMCPLSHTHTICSRSFRSSDTKIPLCSLSLSYLICLAVPPLFPCLSSF